MDGPARVLFTTAPGWGHVHPLVPLARAFHERGCEVLWACAEKLHPALEQAGFRAQRAGIALGEGPPPLDFGKLAELPARERSTYIFSSVFAGVLVPPMLADLLPIVERFRPTLVVHEAAEFAAAIAAAAAGVPSVTHALGRIMPAAQMQAVGEQLAGLWQELGLESPPYAGSYEHLYLDICPPSLQSEEMGHVPRVQQLQPVAFAAGSEAELPSWPASQAARPLVYVTFGTTLASRTAPIATVVEAVRELPVRVIVTLGHDGDPATLGSQPENVHVARYIPQTALLGECDVVVSHAGSGTMFASLARGVPQLCLPQAADQFQNAEACAHAGAGVALSGEEVSAQAVGAAVQELLDTSAPREAAARIAGEIARMPAPGDVADGLARRFAPGR